MKRRVDTIDSFEIKPTRLGIEGTADVKELRFTIDTHHKLSVEIGGAKLLFIWANPPETDRPDPEDPKVKYFKAGQVYEMECLGMESDETVYIEGGAVVKTRMITSNAENVTIRGYGIFDGGYYTQKGAR